MRLALAELSREFYEKVKIVLDRSRLNRIISHTTKLQGVLIFVIMLRVQC